LPSKGLMSSAAQVVRGASSAAPKRMIVFIMLLFRGSHDERSVGNSDQAVVLGMCSDPKPEHATGHLNGDSTIVQANSRGPESSHLLEVERRVLGVDPEVRKGTVRKGTHVGGQLTVQSPETRRGVMNQSLVVRPAA
jgi:hypothetical protein